MANGSIVPRPPLFFVLWFVFSIIHRNGRAAKQKKKEKKKWGRPGNTYHVMWMQVEHGGGAMPTNKFVHNKSENEFFYCFKLSALDLVNFQGFA